jgi:hypothetical protein
MSCSLSQIASSKPTQPLYSQEAFSDQKPLKSQVNKILPQLTINPQRYYHSPNGSAYKLQIFQPRINLDFSWLKN